MAALGQAIERDTPLLTLTAVGDFWTVAGFDDARTGSIRAGQPARVRIDAYPGREFSARVDSLADEPDPALQRLPPDNVQGSFVRLAAPVAVRMRFDGRPDVALQPGMHAEATVFAER